MATIADQVTANTTVQTTVTSTGYMVTEIHEDVRNKSVHATVEFAPFTRGSRRKTIAVWEGTAYEAVRDTWTNADLLAKVATLV